MIKPNELRIGNYFQWSKYSSIGEGIDRITHGQQIMDYSSFKEPIALTEEWLERFGFVWNESIKHFTLNYGCNGVLFLKKYPEYGEGHFGIQLGEHRYKVVQYVHKFQNLCFELTDTELELKTENV